MSPHMRFAIIGQDFSGLARYMTEHGIDYVVFAAISDRQKRDDPHFVYLDFSDEHAVIDSIAAAHAEAPFDGALTIYEQFVAITSRITEALGLPGLPVEAAAACTNKALMRSLFAKAPKKISPDFTTVKSLTDIEAFAAGHSFPLMLKPANLAKSLLVTKSNSLDELRENYQRITERLEPVYARYAPHNERLLIIEEFLEGSMHTVCGFIDAEGNTTLLPYVVDCQNGYDIGFDDNFLYGRLLPSEIPEEIQQDCIEVAEAGIKALGMRSSIAHVELMVGRNGARIIEIGARIGGYRERMYELSYGIDIYDTLLRTASNRPLNLQSNKSEPCAVLELFPKTPGEFVSVSEEEALRELPSLNYISIKYKPGQYAGKAANGYKAACIIILHHTDKAVFDKDLKFVNEQVRVVTQAEDTRL